MSTEPIQVLLVDDEQDLLDICSDSFEMEGFKVSPVLSGEKALELLAKNDFDVVISDFMMPEMSGLEFLSQAQKLCAHKKFPVFIFSTGAVDVNESDVKLKGASAIIIKPFDIDELINLVKEELNKTQ